MVGAVIVSVCKGVEDCDRRSWDYQGENIIA